MARNSKKNRPNIWADGSQNPPFELRSLALASVRLARDSLSGLLARCSDSARDFGAVVDDGRWRLPPERLGRSGRFLPSFSATAAAIRSGAELLSRASRVVLAAAEQQEVQAAVIPAQDMTAWRAPKRVEGSTRGANAAPIADMDLAAIRAMISDNPPATHRVAAEPAPQPAPVRKPVSYAWRRDWLAEKLAVFLGYGLLVVSVPVGFVMAVLAYMDGQDLRKMVSED